jgi:hypothetical protein
MATTSDTTVRPRRGGFYPVYQTPLGANSNGFDSPLDYPVYRTHLGPVGAGYDRLLLYPVYRTFLGATHEGFTPSLYYLDHNGSYVPVYRLTTAN